MEKRVMYLGCIALIMILATAAQGFFIKQTLFEGESQNHTENGQTYEVRLITVYDSAEEAVLEVNGERTDPIGKDESYRFSDGTSIFIRSVLPQQGGDDFVQYNLYPGKPQTPSEEPASEDVAVAEKTVETLPEAEQTAEEPEAAYEDNTDEKAGADPQPTQTEDDDKKDTEPETGIWKRIKNWFLGLFD